jgi:hypothetical protein
MRGAYTQYIKEKGDAVEQAHALRKEKAKLRLARIQNNKEPSHKNGHPKAKEKGI